MKHSKEDLVEMGLTVFLLSWGLAIKFLWGA